MIDPLNAPEKQLVGTYQLEDFSIWEPGINACGPADFDTWTGRMELNADRTAFVCIQLCDQGTTPTVECERHFVWTAETGTIHLQGLEAGQSDVRVEWVREGMGTMTTESFVPTNDPDAGLLLLDDGNESFRWERID